MNKPMNLEQIRDKLKNLSSKIKVDDVQTEKVEYVNPFAVAEEPDSVNLEDKVGLYEYSLDSSRHSVSLTESSNMTQFDLKQFENMVLKVEELKLIDDRLKPNFNGNIIYIACQVPIMNTGEPYFDSFKSILKQSLQSI